MIRGPKLDDDREKPSIWTTLKLVEGQRSPVNHDDELARWVSTLHLHARVARLGIPVAPPSLPRSRRLLRDLHREAERDPTVRVALDAAVQAESLKPGIRRRLVNDPTIRIH